MYGEYSVAAWRMGLMIDFGVGRVLSMYKRHQVLTKECVLLFVVRLMWVRKAVQGVKGCC